MSKVTFEPLADAHIQAVVASLWERGIAEAMIFGVDDLHSLAEYAANRIEDKRAYAAMADGECIAIFGCYPSGAETDQTWFMATERFSDHFVSLTRGLKKLMEQAADEDGFTEMETYSACIHPLSQKWFRLLGLLPDYGYNQVQEIKRFYRRFEPCV